MSEKIKNQINLIIKKGELSVKIIYEKCDVTIDLLKLFKKRNKK
jgi:hypothetical protein